MLNHASIRHCWIGRLRRSIAPALALLGIGCALAGDPAPVPAPAPDAKGFAATNAVLAATKEQPFTNSLGMVFVPVRGSKALFCIWETRVRDFRAFVKDTGHKATNDVYSLRSDGWKQRGDTWESPGFYQTETNPVCAVNWEDATKFCEWLSRKESRKYRLPTDLEWSGAVGLAYRELGKTPKERDREVFGIYPWGEHFPPSPDYGNYAGLEARNLDWPEKAGTIDGFRDQHPRTSPVGSYPANIFGLYDVGGNVWEWCQDWYDGEQKYRVMRGASWFSDDTRSTQSGSRYRYAPTMRNTGIGFRVVLETE